MHLLLTLTTFFSLYQASIPEHWPEPLVQETDDSTKPSIFFALDGVELSVHLFSHPIPPQAQVDRWKKKHHLSFLETTIEPSSHSGFFGLILLSPTWLGAAFQLDARLSSSVSHPKASFDWTITAHGDPEALEKECASILSFIHSFELIEELFVGTF